MVVAEEAAGQDRSMNMRTATRDALSTGAGAADVPHETGQEWKVGRLGKVLSSCRPQTADSRLHQRLTPKCDGGVRVMALLLYKGNLPSGIHQPVW